MYICTLDLNTLDMNLTYSPRIEIIFIHTSKLISCHKDIYAKLENMTQDEIFDFKLFKESINDGQFAKNRILFVQYHITIIG